VLGVIRDITTWWRVTVGINWGVSIGSISGDAEAPGTDPIGGKDFVGNCWNNVHLTLTRKEEASS
jgi:hypothetical protein